MSIEPYGGALVDRRLVGQELTEARLRAAALPRISITTHTRSDLFLIAVGGLSPLEGFMGREDYESVLDRMRLKDGLPWSVPVTLSATRDAVAGVQPGDEVSLTTGEGAIAGTVLVQEIYSWDRNREAEQVYLTTDRAHPGVARLDSLGEVLVAGRITYLYDRDISGFPDRHLTPAETRAEFVRRGWQTVVAFQTRNPVHRAHEYLQKCALEMVDGLLLHPLVGDTKADDVPADVRMECYQVILEHYYPADRVLLSVLPAAMRYAGPREAIFHAIMRRNYGCTHFIVGRDHAGVGNYYGTHDAHKIFDTVDLRALGIQPIRFENTYFCTRCGQMVSPKTCPHATENHVFLSGSKVREMLSLGQRPPAAFSRPEVADVLARSYGTAQPA